MSAIISSYIQSSIAVGRDFLIFGGVVRDFCRDYSRAFVAVGKDLWCEFTPEPKPFLDALATAKTYLPSLPTFSAPMPKTAHPWEKYVFAIAPIVFLCGCAWFLVLMVFVG